MSLSVRWTGGDGQKRHGSYPPPPWAPAVNTAPSTNQTVRGSGLRLGSNTRLKHYITPWQGEWSAGCVFYQLQQVCFLTSCSLEMLLLLTEEGHFLRGFVKKISATSPCTGQIWSCRKTSSVVMRTHYVLLMWMYEEFGSKMLYVHSLRCWIIFCPQMSILLHTLNNDFI